MIYTVTFNPAIDYVVWLDGLRPGAVNRARRELIQFGGKGINVSVMLGRLGVESTALGFLAGFTGRAVEQGLVQDGIKTDFIHLDEGFTRINVKLKGGEETEINGRGRPFPPGARGPVQAAGQADRGGHPGAGRLHPVFPPRRYLRAHPGPAGRPGHPDGGGR